MKFPFRSLTVSISTLLVIASSFASGRPDPLSMLGQPHVPGELLVQFKPGVDDQLQQTLLGRLGIRFTENIRGGVAVKRTGDLALVSLPPGLTVAAAARSLQNNPNIDFAEPNWVYNHQAITNDTYVESNSLWGMTGDFGSGASVAWGAGKQNCNSSGPVYIGIIDEGYMHTHSDLAANAGVNPGEVPGDGIDNDGNGYVDDVYGWDFDGNNSSVFDGAGDDHGTHVAGTIGGIGNNGKGVAGVCWSVKLMSGKFLGSRGGTTANAIKAVDYFTDLKTRHGLKLVATSNSWGGGGYSQALFDAIERSNAAGILFVAAAGNGGSDGVGDNNDVTPSYPSNYTNANVIAVAAISSTGALASFSNYGKLTVDIGAPGVGIWSTVPKSVKGKVVESYSSYSGTSMATPHVSGAVALYAAQNPTATSAQIKSAILSGVTPLGSLTNTTVTGGRLNVSGF